MARLSTSSYIDNKYYINEDHSVNLDTYFPTFLHTNTNTNTNIDTNTGNELGIEVSVGLDVHYQTMINNISTQILNCVCCACKKLSETMTTKIMTQQDMIDYYKQYVTENPEHAQCFCLKSATCQLKN